MRESLSGLSQARAYRLSLLGSCLAVPLLLTTSCELHAESKLAGTWRSNRELSMQFNLSKAKLEERQIEFFNQTLGTMTIEVSNGRYKICDYDREVTIGGKTMPWNGLNESGAYEVIFENADTAIVAYPWPDGVARPSTVHFEGDDTYWIYLADNPSAVDVHAREYFTRVAGDGCDAAANGDPESGDVD